MTFAYKKVEEFREKFCSKVTRKQIDEKGNVLQELGVLYQFKGGLTDDFEHWLKQVLAEAEREGMKKAYIISRNYWGVKKKSEDSVDCGKYKYFTEKLKELNSEQSPELVEGR